MPYNNLVWIIKCDKISHTEPEISHTQLQIQWRWKNGTWMKQDDSRDSAHILTRAFTLFSQSYSYSHTYSYTLWCISTEFSDCQPITANRIAKKILCVVRSYGKTSIASSHSSPEMGTIGEDNSNDDRDGDNNNENNDDDDVSNTNAARASDRTPKQPHTVILLISKRNFFVHEFSRVPTIICAPLFHANIPSMHILNTDWTHLHWFRVLLS